MRNACRCALTVAAVAIGVTTHLLAQSQTTAARDPAIPLVSTGTAVIEGIVVSAADPSTPIQRATLTLTRSAAYDVRVADSDASGRFAFRNLPAGVYLLTAAKGAYVSANYGATRPGVAPTPIPLADGQRFVTRPISLQRGAVIAGRVLTSKGQPVPGVALTATQFFTLAGERRRRTTSSTSGSDTTNVHGEFRIWGLAPGEYVLVTTSTLGMSSIETREVTLAELSWIDDHARRSSTAPPPIPPAGRAFMYAPAFYPGTTDEGQAATLTLKAGEEHAVEFVLPVLRAGAIAGVVTTADGAPVSSVRVSRRPRHSGSLLPRGTVTVITGLDGRFSLNNVGPGDYTISAEGLGRAAGLWAQADVSVVGEDIANLSLQLRPGVAITGRIQFDGQTPAPDPARANVDLIRYASNSQSITVAAADVKTDGTFSLPSIGPGTYRLRATYTRAQSSSPWTATSIIASGSNVLDVPLEIRPDQDLAPVVVTFSDRRTRLTGILADAAGQPVPLFVLMFPVDQQNWFFGTRWIRFTRAGTDGSYELQNLPPGEYYLCALTELEVAQQSEPSFLDQVIPHAIKITLADGETRTQNLRIGG